MKWDVYYENVYDWDEETAIRKISSIRFGPSDEIEYEYMLPTEVAEIISYLSDYDEEAAIRLLKKANAAGIKFSSSDLLDISFLYNEDDFADALYASDDIDETDIGYLSGLVDENVLSSVAEKNDLNFSSPAKSSNSSVQKTDTELAEHKRQLQELLNCSDNALNNLNKAYASLSKGSLTSLLDLAGGGFLVSIAKHSFLKNAEQEIKNAQIALQNLNDELKKLVYMKNAPSSFGKLETFIDIWIDSGFMDFLIHLRIVKIRKNITTAIKQVTDLQKEINEQINNINTL